MKNVTITLEDDLLRWARIKAAELDTSVSKLVGEMLKERMLDESGYEAARRRFFAVPPVRLKEPSGRYPTREELHDRPVLRRYKSVGVRKGSGGGR